MRMEPSEDISSRAQRRQVGRRSVRPAYPSELTLRIDNFTSGTNTPALTTPTPRKYEPKGFLAEVASERRREARVSVPLFLEEVPYSRLSLPPLVPVEMGGREVAALVHTASHVSLVSSALVHELGSRNDVIPDTTLPPCPLNNGSGSPWLVEGKIRYVELTINGSKHVTQLYVARDLPAEIVLGVDFLKKAQVRVSFPESAITIPSTNSGGTSGEVKVAFLTTKEVSQHRQNNYFPPNAANTRAYSSNY